MLKDAAKTKSERKSVLLSHLRSFSVLTKWPRLIWRGGGLCWHSGTFSGIFLISFIYRVLFSVHYWRDWFGEEDVLAGISGLGKHLHTWGTLFYLGIFGASTAPFFLLFLCRILKKLRRYRMIFYPPPLLSTGVKKVNESTRAYLILEVYGTTTVVNSVAFLFSVLNTNIGWGKLGGGSS